LNFGWFAGGEKAVHPEVRQIVSARLPVQRRKLPTAELPEDEEGRAAHENVQTEKEWSLPDLQATHCSLLLSRQILYGEYRMLSQRETL